MQGTYKQLSKYYTSAQSANIQKQIHLNYSYKVHLLYN